MSYNSIYYEKNKVKMQQQIADAQRKRYKIKQQATLLKKLNSGEYKRIPYSLLTKHNIKYDTIENHYKYDTSNDLI
jgi:hypothetical protein